MKAKDYAAQFEANSTLETLTNIGNSFLAECKYISIARKCRSNDAVIAVFNEQDRKWKAFARLIDGIRPDGFQMLVKKTMPEIYSVWKAND